MSTAQMGGGERMGTVHGAPIITRSAAGPSLVLAVPGLGLSTGTNDVHGISLVDEMMVAIFYTPVTVAAGVSGELGSKCGRSE